MHTSTAMETPGVQVRRSEAVIAALRASTPVQQPYQTATDHTLSSQPQPKLSEACQIAPLEAGPAQPAGALGTDQPASGACKDQPPVHRAADAASAQCPSCGCSCARPRARDMLTHARDSSAACGRRRASSADSAAVSDRPASAHASAAELRLPAWPEQAGGAEADAIQERGQSANQSRHTQSTDGDAHASERTSSRRVSTRHNAAPQRQSVRHIRSMHSDATRPRSPPVAARTCSSSVLGSGAGTRRSSAPACSERSGRLRTPSDRLCHRPTPVAEPHRQKRPSLRVPSKVVGQDRTSGMPATPAEVSTQLRAVNGWDVRQQQAHRTSDTCAADRDRRPTRGVTAAKQKRPLLNGVRRAGSTAASKGAPCRLRTPTAAQSTAPIPKSRCVVALADLC